MLRKFGSYGEVEFIITEQTRASWAERLIQFRWFTGVAGIALFLLAWGPSRQIQLDRSITSMFAADDPALLAYRSLQRDFGGNAVVLLVYRDPELLTPSGLLRNDEISRRVAAARGVQGILSPASLNQVLRTMLPEGPAAMRGQDPDSETLPPLLRDEPIASRFERLFSGYTHSVDGRSGAVVAMLHPDHDRSTIVELRQIAGSLPQPLGTADLVGEPVLLHDGFDLLERDGATLASWTILLLGIVLLVTLQNLRFVVLAVVVIVWADTMTRASLVWLKLGLSLVSTILIAVVAVIAVAAVLHLGVRWLVSRRRHHDRRAATATVISLLAAPIFWTCVTDAAGFASLGVSQIVPVREFGGMIGGGAIFILMAFALFSPLLLLIGPRAAGLRGVDRVARGQLEAAIRSLFRQAFTSKRSAIQRRWVQVDRSIHKACLRLARGSVAWRRVVLSIAAGIGSVAAWQTAGMVTETSFLNNFRPASRIVTAYERVEREFGGAGVWDIVLAAPRNPSEEYLNRIRELQEELRAIDVGGATLTKVLSLADAEAIVADMPLLSLASPGMRLTGMRVAMPVFSDALLTADVGESPRRLRIMLRSYEHLPAEQKLELIDEVRRVVAKHTGGPDFAAVIDRDAGLAPTHATVTGYYVMMTGLVSRLLADQWRCFVVALLTVWGLLAVATRSFRLSAAALIPNLLPVFIVLAVSGWLGGKLNMGAAMIAAVSIGLTIDGSVHFMASYRRYRRRGHALEIAAVHAAGKIGLPVVLATVALIAGFGVIATSQFVPTATFGRLVAASLAVGTMVNLSVLPAAVVCIDRRLVGSPLR